MNCIKCGRETVSEQVFCPDCQLEMEKYPVQPGTIVQLPNRKELPVRRNVPKRRSVPLEEQVRILKNQVRNLTIALLVAATLAVLLAKPAIQYMMEDHFQIGQNYTTVVTNTVPTDID